MYVTPGLNCPENRWSGNCPRRPRETDSTAASTPRTMSRETGLPFLPGYQFDLAPVSVMHRA
jgi:hypothetical protein